MAKKEGKKWSPAQRAKFRKTVAAKKANTPTSIPLSAIPNRPAATSKASTARAASARNHNKQQLVHDVVRLLQTILEA